MFFVILILVDFFDYLELTKDGVELYTDEDTFYPYLRELVEDLNAKQMDRDDYLSYKQKVESLINKMI